MCCVLFVCVVKGMCYFLFVCVVNGICCAMQARRLILDSHLALGSLEQYPVVCCESYFPCTLFVSMILFTPTALDNCRSCDGQFLFCINVALW